MALSIADYAYALETGPISLGGPGKELAASEEVQKACRSGWWLNVIGALSQRVSCFFEGIDRAVPSFMRHF